MALAYPFGKRPTSATVKTTARTGQMRRTARMGAGAAVAAAGTRARVTSAAQSRNDFPSMLTYGKGVASRLGSGIFQDFEWKIMHLQSGKWHFHIYTRRKKQ